MLLIQLAGMVTTADYVMGFSCSWLYSSEVTVSRVLAAEDASAERLKVWAVFSEQTLHKFLSKFSGDNISISPCQNCDLSMRRS